MYHTLLKIHQRLLTEGYIIKNGKKIRRSDNSKKRPYTLIKSMTMSEKNIEKKLDLILKQIESIKDSLIAKGHINDDREDKEVYQRAKEVVVEAGKASTALLQRKLKIGYAHASRIMGELEDEGIIGPGTGAKPRKVLKSK